MDFSIVQLAKSTFAKFSLCSHFDRSIGHFQMCSAERVSGSHSLCDSYFAVLVFLRFCSHSMAIDRLQVYASIQTVTKNRLIDKPISNKLLWIKITDKPKHDREIDKALQPRANQNLVVSFSKSKMGVLIWTIKINVSNGRSFFRHFRHFVEVCFSLVCSIFFA